MAKKKIVTVVKIQIEAGKASPAPPVGTALGPHGIAIMDFVKAYNAATESQAGTVVPTEITIYEDRTFTFVLKTPPTAVLVREKAGLAKAANNPGSEVAGFHHRGAAGRDRHDQAARPQRLRPRSRQAPGPRHRPLHGDQGRLTTTLAPSAPGADCVVARSISVLRHRTHFVRADCDVSHRCMPHKSNTPQPRPRSPRSAGSTLRETSHVR